MKGGLMPFAKDLLMAAVFRGRAFACPDTLYCGLLRAQPTGTGLPGLGETKSNEVAGEGYARVAMAFTDPRSDGRVLNVDALAFPRSSDELGRVTHLAWFDKPDGGKLWAWGELAKSKLLEPNDRFVIEPGAVDARLELGAG